MTNLARSAEDRWAVGLARSEGGCVRVWLAVLVCSMALTVLAACGARVVDLEPSPRARFIAEDPQQVTDLEELSSLPRSVGWGLTGADEAWKVELDHEVRNVFLARPGHSVERRLTVERGSLLRLAYRTQQSVRSPVTFRVAVVVAGGRSEVLLQVRVEPSSAASGVWHEAELDLAPFVGRTVRLSLQTTSDGTFDPNQGLAFWGNPEVVTPDAWAEPAGVVLISVDALRADHLSLYGYPLRTSPNLDAWARREAVTFRNVVAPAPWTLPSHISLFTGLDCVRHGINHDVGGVKNEVGLEPSSALVMLAEVLRRAGYATAAFTGGAYLHPRYGFSQGFDVYGYWPDRARDLDELSTGVDRALSWIERRRTEPFLFFLHTYEVHDPYRARQPYFRDLAPVGVDAPSGRVALRSPPNRPEEGFMQHNELVMRSPGQAERPVSLDELPTVRAMYDSGIAYTDEQFGRLLAGLERLGVKDRTLVVFTADHGEALGEDGLAGHIYLYDHNLMIPLVMAIPGGRGAGRSVEDQVRLVDLFPTVLEVLGLRAEQGIDGVSLLPLADGKSSPVPPFAWSYSAAANRGLGLRYDNRVKYVLNNTAWPPVSGRERVHDLVEDEREEHDLSASSPLLGELRQRARTYLDEHAVGLRIRFANGSGGRLRGDLTGHMVRPVGTKSPDLGEPWLRWSEMGRATFEVPAGGEFTLSFEKVFGSRVRLFGSLELEGREIPFDRTFSVRKIDAAQVLALDGTRFVAGAGRPGEVEIGFELWWHGAVTLRTGSPADVDSQLREQLEALGYIQ